MRTYSRVIFGLQVTRPAGTYALKLLLPMLLVALTAALALSVHPQYVEGRIGIGITALLTLVALQLTSDSGLPDVNNLILLDKLYILSYVFVVLTMAVIVRNSWVDATGDVAAATRADRRGLFLAHDRLLRGRGRAHGLQPRMSRDRPRLLGVNHVALEVGDLDAALDFYGSIFEFELRGRVPGMAFLEMGDQFIAIAEGRSQGPDDGRHFGLVVDDKDAARAALEAAGAKILGGRGLDFLDPWGNRVQVVDYREIQFSKTPGVLAGMGVEIEKSESALAELREKGLDGSSL